MTQEIKPGVIVRIISGRGEGRLALVVSMTDDGRARIADGRRIRIETPKVKSCKHLQPVIVATEGEPWEKRSNRAIWSIITKCACGIIEQEGLFCQRMT